MTSAPENASSTVVAFEVAAAMIAIPAV